MKNVFTKLGSDDDCYIKLNTYCLPNLKTLYIFQCPRLEYVFPLLSNNQLQKIEAIIIKHYENLESAFNDLERDDDHQIESNTLCWTNLNTLEIDESLWLEYVYHLLWL